MAITFLILSICFSTLISLIFRSFAKYNVSKLQAILVNYLVCFIIGFSLSNQRDLSNYITTDWFLYCLFLGFLFVAIFFSMASTVEKIGISVNAVSSKMAVVVPIMFAYFFANEEISTLFFFGIIISLLSIYFISVKKHLDIPKKYYLFPVIVFLGSGVIDTALKALQTAYVEKVSLNTISYSIFLGAFIAGILVFLVKSKGSLSLLNKTSLKAGVILGIPNYFSILFLLEAINAFSLKSAFVFGINNVGIVLLSTILSVVFFKEHLSIKNKIGVGLAVFSIIIIAYGN